MCVLLDVLMRAKRNKHRAHYMHESSAACVYGYRYRIASTMGENASMGIMLNFLL